MRKTALSKEKVLGGEIPFQARTEGKTARKKKRDCSEKPSIKKNEKRRRHAEKRGKIPVRTRRNVRKKKEEKQERDVRASKKSTGEPD